MGAIKKVVDELNLNFEKLTYENKKLKGSKVKLEKKMKNMIARFEKEKEEKILEMREIYIGQLKD